jgi:hypothetical protein
MRAGNLPDCSIKLQNKRIIMLPILLALAFIFLLLIVFVGGQPDEFKLSRSAAISVAAEKIFPHVNDLHKWEAWSPWARLDPTAKSTFSGPDAGTGAAMRWEGNSKVGAGTMTITDSKAGEIIRFRLEFEKPMRATNTAEFSFKSDGHQTLVTWSMIGKNSLVGKLFGLMMNCEKMVGRQFEQGLAALKSVSEKM